MELERVQFINLLPRFYDPQKGKSFYRWTKYQLCIISSLRKNISLVSQDIILFDDTVHANIAYANINASENQIKKACDFAAASVILLKITTKYKTIIGENGIKVIRWAKTKNIHC